MTIEASGEGLMWLEATLTVDTSAYATGELMGKAAGGTGVASNPIELALPDTWNRAHGYLIQSVALVDQASQRAAIDVVFFNADPSATTFTDQAALDIADADMDKIAGVASVTTYASFADNAFGQATNLGIVAVQPGDTLYACLVSRGAPTYAAANDLRLRVGVVRLS
jgi:hypothetical protein